MLLNHEITMEMQTIKKYSFETISRCEMCGFTDNKNTVLGQRLNCRQGLSRRGFTGISVTIKRCTECGLIYSNPLPIPSSISDHYQIPLKLIGTVNILLGTQNILRDKYKIILYFLGGGGG